MLMIFVWKGIQIAPLQVGQERLPLLGQECELEGILLLLYKSSRFLKDSMRDCLSGGKVPGEH